MRTVSVRQTTYTKFALVSTQLDPLVYHMYTSVLALLERLGLVWDIREVPEYVRDGKSKQESDRGVLKNPIEITIPVPAEEIPA